MKTQTKAPFVARIKSGSMYPTLKIGDTVLIQKVPFATVEVGDVIGFTSHKGIPLVHRVVWKTHQTLTTVADASRQADQPISKDDFLGKVIMTKNHGRWCKVSGLTEVLKLQQAVACLSGKITNNPTCIWCRGGRKLLLYGMSLERRLVCN